MSSINETSRGYIRSIRIYAAARGLEETSPEDSWPSICRYLASKVQLRHLALVPVNNCSLPQTAVEDMQRLCRMEIPWVKYLTWVSGLRSFTLHAARCPYRDTAFEARDRCPTTLPLASEVINLYNEKHEWTTEDRMKGLIIEEGGVTSSKNPLTRHIERYHFNAFYGQRLGACISQAIKEPLRKELGIESSAQIAKAETS